MNCLFCHQSPFATETRTNFTRYFCADCTTLFDYADSTLLRYHISLPNEYSIRVSHKTNTIRLYYQKDVHGITKPMLTLNQTNPNITPSNAETWVKRLLDMMVFS